MDKYADISGIYSSVVESAREKGSDLPPASLGTKLGDITSRLVKEGEAMSEESLEEIIQALKEKGYYIEK